MKRTKSPPTRFWMPGRWMDGVLKLGGYGHTRTHHIRCNLTQLGFILDALEKNERRGMSLDKIKRTAHIH